jgi:hypothetical protein
VVNAPSASHNVSIERLRDACSSWADASDPMYASMSVSCDCNVACDTAVSTTHVQCTRSLHPTRKYGERFAKNLALKFFEPLAEVNCFEDSS